MEIKVIPEKTSSIRLVIIPTQVGIFKIAALGVALFLISGGAARDIITIAGVGTIITAFFMGPLIEIFNVHSARPVLNGKRDGGNK